MTQQDSVKIVKIEKFYRIVKTGRIYGMAYDYLQDAVEALENAKKSDYWFDRQK